MSKFDLDAIKTRERNATKGPWVYERSGPVTAPTMFEIAPPGPDGRADWAREVAATVGGTVQDQANAAFIVHARADVPAMVLEIERLTALQRPGTEAADDFIVKLMNLNAAQHRIIMDCVATQRCSPFAMRYFETEMRLKYGDDWRAYLDKELADNG